MTPGAGEPGAYRRLLALPVPRRLALASLPADFADWLDYAAIVAVLVYIWGEGPSVLALFALALTIPYVVVGPLLAVVVDRTPTRRVLVLSNLGRAATTAALAFAAAPAALLFLVFLRASIDSAFTPARQSAIRTTTPPDLLGAANGLHHAINQVSKIAGPALGGALLALWPPAGVFAANAVLSLVATLLVATLRLPPRDAPAAPPRAFRAELADGLAEYARSPALRAALGFSAAAYFSFFLYDALIGLLTTELGFGPTLFGFGIAASGAGGLLGALLAGTLAGFRPLPLMAGAALVSGAVTATLAAATIGGLPVAGILFLAALALMGGSTSVMLVPYRTIVQREAPPDRIARVFAAGEAVTMAAMLSAPLVGSVIASKFGTAAAFLAGGVLLLVLGGLTLVVGGRRGDRQG